MKEGEGQFLGVKENEKEKKAFCVNGCKEKGEKGLRADKKKFTKGWELGKKGGGMFCLFRLGEKKRSCFAVGK